MSLRRRLLLACAAVAVVLFVADVALASTFRSFLLDRLDRQLTVAAERIADPSPGRPGADGRRGPRRIAPPRSGNPALSEYYIGLAAADGTIVEVLGDPLSAQALPEPAPDAVAEAASPGDDVVPFDAESADGDGWRLVAVDATGRGEPIVVIGGPLREVDSTYARMVVVLAVATVAVLVTLVVVAWWLLRHGVRPLATMTTTAEAIADGALSERVPAMDPRTEAGRLGDALNTMLGRIEHAFAERAASEDRLRRFVADASHELRTPLTSVRGYAELYRAGALAEDDAIDDAMRRVEQEAARMSDLVDDLLLLAKLDEGRPLRHRTVRLDRLALDAVRDASAAHPSRSISCTADPVQVVGDEARLQQALANLLTNACTHTPPDATIDVAVRRDGSSAVAEVVDDGPGMSAEVAGRVFERFYRADPARARTSGGSGLGLAIVAGIAEAHGGTAEVESSPGHGSRFRLRLPLPVPETPGRID
ncbi:MAG TPA: HAMP domain-containing sensor histidine kinase [Euzebyales bacterium]